MTILAPLQVQQNSYVTGTADYTLSDTLSSDFVKISDFYTTGTVTAFFANGKDNWEYFLGTLTVGTPSIVARTTIIAGSNGTSKVNWPYGVITLVPAELAMTRYPRIVSGAVTLGVQDWGQCAVFTSYVSGQHVVLPAIASTPAGYSTSVVNNTSSDVGITLHGGDSVIAGPTVVSKNSSLDLVKAPTGWVVMAGGAGSGNVTVSDPDVLVTPPGLTGKRFAAVGSSSADHPTDGVELTDLGLFFYAGSVLEG